MNKTDKFSNKVEISFLEDFGTAIIRPLLGIFLGLLAGGILIAASGVNPFTAYAAMARGAFSTPQSFANVLVRASPLLLGGAGVAIGIKAGVWNIGMEGYMYMGAIGAGIVGILPLHIPSFLHIILCLIAGIITAGIWGSIPGYLRAYHGVNEVTVTIMMNYIAQFFCSWMVHEPQFMAEPGSFFPMSLSMVETAKLPILMRGTSLHPGFIIGIVLCIILFLIIRLTAFGFQIRMLGTNPEAARYAGVNTKKRILMVFIIGAILGGLAGAIEILGLKNRVYMDFVAGVGNESVAVALLASGNPIGVIATALFLSALKVGGATMSISTGVGGPATTIIIALCVIFVIAMGQGEPKQLRLDKEEKKDVEVNQHVS